MPKRPKEEIYREIAARAEALLGGLSDEVAAMASAASVIHEGVPWASWTGFYRVVEPGLLRIGPYQGPPGCVEIAFGKGVCGTAAERRETLIVPDVHAFPGHIACDPSSLSEIVVPVLDARGEMRAVLDVDSRRPGAFDDADRAGLEAVARLLPWS